MDEDYYYRSQSTIDPATIFTIAAIAGLFVLLGIITQWRIFRKAGKPGWAAIVPFYNLYTLLKIVGKRGWWLFLFLVPLVNFYVAIKSVHLLSKSFGKDLGFTLGLLFLPFVFYPILAFSSAKYRGPYGDRAAFEAYQNQNSFEFETATYERLA